MQYFGVPTCPYCKKRVNLIRTWSLKRQGEYQCPRCGGISNIYLSPLIYVVALLALFAGGAVYFFHKFVLNDITLDTALQVFLPFAIFFLLSVFFVYLAKPVIKKVSREEMERKKHRRSKDKDPHADTAPRYYDQEDYPARQVQAAAPISQPVQPRVRADAPAPAPVRSRPAPVPESQLPISRRLDAAAAPYQQQSAVQPRPLRQPVSVARPQQATSAIRPPVPVSRPARPAALVAQPVSRQTPQAVSSVQTPAPADDFFAKYDDPDYVKRRLNEIKSKE